MNEPLPKWTHFMFGFGYTEADIRDWLAWMDNPHAHAQSFIGWRGYPEDTVYTGVRYPVFKQQRYLP